MGHARTDPPTLLRTPRLLARLLRRRPTSARSRAASATLTILTRGNGLAVSIPEAARERFRPARPKPSTKPAPNLKPRGRSFLANRTEADFQAWRDQQVWTAWKICHVGRWNEATDAIVQGSIVIRHAGDSQGGPTEALRYFVATNSEAPASIGRTRPRRRCRRDANPQGSKKSRITGNNSWISNLDSLTRVQEPRLADPPPGPPPVGSSTQTITAPPPRHYPVRV
jgi:hypothetical protein